ncbi:MAG: Crp/Fnr family transcriptional regulator [Clostridiaceae bacterium]|jgi:CRP/FNR family transcriptional regulator, dissimilatory nitrate respiration regulator|nr:Crp/Fnr family transcriptional regulator [Clostridiaceae bacterium]
MDIFYGISDSDKSAMLNCLRAVKKTYLKDEIVFDETKALTAVGYLEKGHLRLLKDDYEGNKLIISDIKEGETFGEAIVSQDVPQNQIYGQVTEDSEILFMDFSRILSMCQNTCPFHKKLIENLIKNITSKNVILQQRIELLSKKTLRERILSFLYEIKNKQKSIIFEIPYSREQMAEFLGADRSALSRELSKMKAENLIDYHKNSFKILK